MFKNFRKHNKDFPEYWKNYLEKFNHKIDLNKEISDAKFIVFDIESEGLNPKRDKILSIGAIPVVNNRINTSESFEVFIKQDSTKKETVPIHGILQSSINKIAEEEALKRFIDFIGNSILFGHNISFDISILNRAIQYYCNDTLKNFIFDTKNLYKRIKGGSFSSHQNISLDFLCEEYGIEKNDRHTSAGDALITGMIFLKMIPRLKGRGITTLENLIKQKIGLI